MFPSTLDDSRRREYLAALGVPIFVARRVLPGAAVSQPLVPVEAPTLNVPPRWQLPPPVMPATRELEAPNVLQQSAVKPIVADEAKSTPVAPPRFACRLMSLAEQGFVLLDLGQVPDLVPGEIIHLAPSEQQLWRHIQRAAGWVCGEPEPDFMWPRAVKGLLGDDADTARDMLSSWLKRQIPNDQRLWVFGESLSPFLDRPHRLLPSLQQLLLSPLAKRQLWLQLCQSTNE